MKAMSHQLQEVKSQVGKLQQSRDPFPFQPVIPNDDDDDDDDDLKVVADHSKVAEGNPVVECIAITHEHATAHHAYGL